MNTVLGPLTTVFTAPKECATVWTNFEGANRGQTCGGGVLAEDAACHPTSIVTQPTSAWQGEGYFSPGLYCPDGYATACYGGGLATSSPSFSFQFSASPSLGVAGCCPSGYTCNYATFNICSGGTAASCSQSFQNCVSTPAATAMVTGASCVATGAVSDVTFKAPSVFAPMIQLVAEITSSPSGSMASADSQIPSNMSSGKGLAGGAIAGIVVGCIAAAFILLASILYLLRRARRNGRSFTRRTTPEEKALGWSELSDSQRSELSDTQRNELADSQRTELPDFQRIELPVSK